MATLKLVVQEDITLDGNDRSTYYQHDITGINSVDHRTMTIPADTEAAIFNLSNNVGAGTFLTSSIKYARISNVTTSSFVDVHVSSSTESAHFKVDGGSIFTLSTSEYTGSLSSSYAYDDIASIKVKPSGSSAKIEYFIATT
jgi:hypothetical protein